eukprot:432261_1
MSGLFAFCAVYEKFHVFSLSKIIRRQYKLPTVILLENLSIFSNQIIENQFIIIFISKYCLGSMCSHAHTTEQQHVKAAVATYTDARLGGIMILAEQIVVNLLQNKPVVYLRHLITKHSAVIANNSDCDFVFAQLQKLKFQVKTTGTKMIERLYNTVVISNVVTLDHEICFILAKTSENKKDFAKAQLFYFSCIVTTDSFYEQMLSLRYLSNLCSKYFLEYAIAWRLLRYARAMTQIGKIVDGKSIYFPSRICKDYKKQKRLRKKIKSMLCHYCGCKWSVIRKLKCCIGCMKVFYCCKNHQKQHWSVHRKKCDKKWLHNYGILKSNVDSF